MALAIDSSTPAAIAVGGSTTGTTNSFSPPANSLIVLFVEAIAFSASLAVSSVSDSLGTHLTWNTLAANTQSVSGNGAGAELWYAPCPSAQTSMTVTATWNTSTLSGDGMLMPVVFTGAATTQSGATGSAGSGTAVSSYSASCTTTAANSWVIGCISSWNGQTPTAGTGSTFTINAHSAHAGWGWGQIENSTTPSSGTNVTLSDTVGTAAQYSMVVAEILAAAGTPAVIPDLIMAPMAAS